MKQMVVKRYEVRSTRTLWASYLCNDPSIARIEMAAAQSRAVSFKRDWPNLDIRVVAIVGYP